MKGALEKFPRSEHKAVIWGRISDLYWELKNKDSYFAAAEMSLHIDRLQKDVRFRIAYRYADNQSCKVLVYYHYDKLRSQDERYPNCLNNMAIILQELNMFGQYVRLLKRAKEFDQPYPHGNLALALAKAGFLDEARGIIELQLPARAEA